MDKEVIKRGRQAAEGLLGAYKQLLDLKDTLLAAEALDADLEVMRDAKISIGTEVAEAGDKLNYLKQEVQGLQGKIDTTMSELETNMKLRRRELEDNLSARKAEVNAEIADLDSSLATVRTTHAEALKRLTLEKAAAEAATANATAELQALRAKLG